METAGSLLAGPLDLNGSGKVPVGYFACVGCGNIALPVGFQSSNCYNKNGLYGGNSNEDDCVSDMQQGDEDDELYGRNSGTHNFFDKKNYEENCVSDMQSGDEKDP